MNLRRDFSGELKQLTQRSYLLAAAIHCLGETKDADIARNLPSVIGQLSSDQQLISSDSVKMTAAQVSRSKKHLPSFVTDILLVELQSIFHTHLMLAAGYSLDKEAIMIEALLVKLWPKCMRHDREWAHKEVILLTEIRNSVMHAIGEVQPNQRLQDAGWSQEEMASDKRLKSRSFSDFLRFKRAVRTVANEALISPPPNPSD